MSAAMLEDLRPGISVDVTGVTVTILRDREPARDALGRAMHKLWAKRHDTGAEGYLIVGDAVAFPFAETPEAAK